MKSEEIQKHLNVFHNLLVDILRRREIFRIFEKNLVGKAEEIAVKNNWFVSFYVTDYTRNQLIDLRKFFETDGKSYKIRSLIGYLKDKNLKKVHRGLFKRWNKDFEKQVNSLIAHLDQNTENLAKEIAKKDLDSFIDEINTFFDSIVETFRTQGNIVSYDDMYRYGNGTALRERSLSEFDQYMNY